MILDAFALSAVRPWIVFSPDDGDGGGSTGGGADPQVWQSFQNFLNRNDGAQQAAFTLFQENYQQRQELRELRDTNAQLKAQTQRLPKEGAIVLEDEDAETYRKLKATGKLGDFEKILKEHEERGNKISRYEREQTLRDVADKVGFNFTVLRDRDLVTEGLSYETRQVDVEGQKREVVFVKQGEGEAKPLLEYAQSNWSDYMPALTKDASAGTGQAQTRQKPPVQWPKQNSSQTGGNASSVVDKFIQQRDEAQNKRHNPLRRQANGE